MLISDLLPDLNFPPAKNVLHSEKVLYGKGGHPCASIVCGNGPAFLHLISKMFKIQNTKGQGLVDWIMNTGWHVTTLCDIWVLVTHMSCTNVCIYVDICMHISCIWYENKSMRRTYGSIHKILMVFGKTKSLELSIQAMLRRWRSQTFQGAGCRSWHLAVGYIPTVGVSFWGVTTGVGCYVN